MKLNPELLKICSFKFITRCVQFFFLYNFGNVIRKCCNCDKYIFQMKAIRQGQCNMTIKLPNTGQKIT